MITSGTVALSLLVLHKKYWTVFLLMKNMPYETTVKFVFFDYSRQCITIDSPIATLYDDIGRFLQSCA